jgi:cytochrome c biogenesis protein CcdA
MVGLLITIVAIAMVDALNLSTIVSCAFLLNTPHPVRRTISYIAGVFMTYYLIGAALLIGFGDRINRVVDRAQSNSVQNSVKLVVAFALVAMAIHHWIRRTRARSRSQKPLRSLNSTHPATAFTFGVTMTVIDLTTAIPYVAALGSIASTRLHRVAELGLLLVYNVIYLIPAIALLLSRIRWGPQSVEAIERTRMKLSVRFSDRRWAFVPGVAGIVLTLWAAVT